MSIGFNPDHETHRETYRQQIHDIIRSSYSKIGGYSGFPSGSELESDAIHSDISKHNIKLVHRSGKVTAVALYKDAHGRKGIGKGTDGSLQGKKDLYKIMEDDNVLQRSWSEVSGALEHIHNKIGSPKVPFEKAKKLVDKSDMMPDNDEVHYTRSIGGKKFKKVVVGYPKS